MWLEILRAVLYVFLFLTTGVTGAGAVICLSEHNFGPGTICLGAAIASAIGCALM